MPISATINIATPERKSRIAGQVVQNKYVHVTHNTWPVQVNCPGHVHHGTEFGLGPMF